MFYKSTLTLTLFNKITTEIRKLQRSFSGTDNSKDQINGVCSTCSSSDESHMIVECTSHYVWDKIFLNGLTEQNKFGMLAFIIRDYFFNLLKNKNFTAHLYEFRVLKYDLDTVVVMHDEYDYPNVNKLFDNNYIFIQSYRIKDFLLIIFLVFSFFGWYYCYTRLIPTIDFTTICDIFIIMKCFLLSVFLLYTFLPPLYLAVFFKIPEHRIGAILNRYKYELGESIIDSDKLLKSDEITRFNFRVTDFAFIFSVILIGDLSIFIKALFKFSLLESTELYQLAGLTCFPMLIYLFFYYFYLGD